MDQPDLFLPTISDVRTRDIRDFMSHNWFSLSKKKRTEPIHHQVGDNWVRIRGTQEFGIATVYDQDVLLFLISNLQERIDSGQPIDTRDQLFSIYDFAKFRGLSANKISGATYLDIKAALQRLTSTTVETDIRGSGWGIFPLLSGATQRDVDTIKGPVFDTHYFRVQLPPFIFDAVVRERQVLSFSREYFSIRGALRRFLFLYARKSIGNNKSEWKESIHTFMPKTATLSSTKEFRRMIRAMTDKPVLNYTVRLDDDDNIIFRDHKKRK